MSTNTRRLLASLTFFVWIAFLIAAFYVTQKPAFLAGIHGFAATCWVLGVWAALVTNAAGVGYLLLQRLPELNIQPVEHLLLGAGIGLGFLGLGGFLFGLIGWIHPLLLIGIQSSLLLLLWWSKGLQAVWMDLRALGTAWRAGMTAAPRWLHIALFSTLLFSFLLALAPPAEAFDALFYHLVVPERFLNGVGLQPSSVPHFWFPALPEGLFLWAQGMGAVRTTQLLHLTWAVLGIVLLWHWAASVWGAKTAQGTLVILLSMPSLFVLASWAYTDFVLTFYGLAAIFGVYKAFDHEHVHLKTGWVIIAGIAAGMSMAVKYTSFLVPLSSVLLMLWWGRKHLAAAFKAIMVFGAIAFGVAAPWYLRSWIVMGNPFYPFAFGGLGWDPFRTAWYAESGTGIGWKFKELILLPLNATLGHRDANYFDGRMGPLYLILSPLTAYVLLTGKEYPRGVRRMLLAITLYTLLSIGAWVFGVMNSAALWQTRLLFPALIPFALPSALGFLALKKLDTPQLRLSYIFNFVVVAVVAVTVIEAGISVLMRNPLTYALGIETQQAYLAKVQPSYAQAMQLLEGTPEDASIYFLFEPRSYYAPRDVQIDPILDNFAHDWFTYTDAAAVLRAWISNGYSHVLINRRGVDFLAKNRSDTFTPDFQAAFEVLLQDLILMGTTDDGAYELYLIKLD